MTDTALLDHLLGPSARRDSSGRQILLLTALAPWPAAAVVACTLLGVTAALVSPWVIAMTLESVTGGKGYLWPVFWVVALLGARALSDSGRHLFGVELANRITAKLRTHVIQGVFSLGLKGARSYTSGDLLSRVMNNAAGASGSLFSFLDMLVGFAMSLGGLAGLALFDWPAATVFLAAILPTLVLIHFFARRLGAAYPPYMEHLSSIAGRLADALIGSRTIKVAGTVSREVDRVLMPMTELNACAREIWRVQRSSWRIHLSVLGVCVIVLGAAGEAVGAGRLNPGAFLACVLYLNYALGFLGAVGTVPQWASSQASLNRVRDLISEHSSSAHRNEPLAILNEGPGALTYRGIVVREDGRRILDGVDLDIPGGSEVALVGMSGTGKTTLALLANRLLEPDAGHILIDGVRIDSLDHQDVCRAVTYVSDRPELTGGTIAEALSCGRPGQLHENLTTAAATAQALDFIRNLPEDFQSTLSNLRLSGGEVQRLGLARAAMRPGRIIIFDDATSNLDTITEERVARAFAEAFAGVTRLVITHRPAAAARADMVAWLDGGRIRATAPHHLLWAAEPAYRAVFASQSEAST